MDGDYDGDTFMDYEDDDDWLYVEDDYALSDELAENQIASPGYSGTNHEVDLETSEFDLYGYWLDLHYGDDAYWEKEDRHGPNDVSKRKRLETRADVALGKRRKTDPPPPPVEPVRFESRKERDRRYLASPPVLTEKVSFAFMPDWRERFADSDGSIATKPMPADMKKAAESEATLEPILDDEGEEEDDYDDMDEEAAEAQTLDIDSEMLESILGQRFSDAGLNGADQAMFMQAILQMKSGGSNMDDALAVLTNSLLNRISEKNDYDDDDETADWLKRQGVSLHDDEDASSATTAKMTEDSSSIPSAVDLSNSVKSNSTSHQPPQVLKNRKRRSLTNDEEQTKRKKIAPSEQDEVRRDSMVAHQIDDSRNPSNTARTHHLDTGLSQKDSNGAGASAYSGLDYEGVAMLASDAEPSSNQRKRKAIEVVHDLELKRVKYANEAEHESTQGQKATFTRTKSTKTTQKGRK